MPQSLGVRIQMSFEIGRFLMLRCYVTAARRSTTAFILVISTTVLMCQESLRSQTGNPCTWKCATNPNCTGMNHDCSIYGCYGSLTGHPSCLPTSFGVTYAPVSPTYAQAGGTLSARMMVETVFLIDGQGGKARFTLADVMESNGAIHVTDSASLPG